MNTISFPCDGCGQPASPEHIARRLQRLEWATRFRPVHISALLLGGISPPDDGDFLYAGKFEGEGARLLEAADITLAGKSPEAVLAEFQKRGFFLTHVLECPVENSQAESSTCETLLLQRVPQAMARIRRSLKPKRVVLISELLAPLLMRLTAAEMGCQVILNDGKPYGLDASGDDQMLPLLKASLVVTM